jgi:hypothetical protein
MDTLNKHFRALTQTVFAKQGFAQADVVMQWQAIVGERIAAFARPLRVRLPRGGALAGGTLHVAAAPGRSLDVQYAEADILEKVNRFLGYRAVATLKVSAAVQWPAPTAPTPSAPAPTAAMLAGITTISDEPLQAALTRLGGQISAARPRSPQAQQADGTPPSLSSRTET